MEEFPRLRFIVWLKERIKYHNGRLPNTDHLARLSKDDLMLKNDVESRIDELQKVLNQVETLRQGGPW